MREKAVIIKKILEKPNEINLSDVIKLLETSIDECRRNLEIAERDDFIKIQGEVRAYRKLMRGLMPIDNDT